MVSDVKKIKSNNKILISRDQNCTGMTAGNTSGRIPHQFTVLTVIER